MNEGLGCLIDKDRVFVAFPGRLILPLFHLSTIQENLKTRKTSHSLHILIRDFRKTCQDEPSTISLARSCQGAPFYLPQGPSTLPPISRHAISYRPPVLSRRIYQVSSDPGFARVSLPSRFKPFPFPPQPCCQPSGIVWIRICWRDLQLYALCEQ
jgi:hypothetical protein